MGFAISPDLVPWIKGIAAVVAVLTAYGAKGDSLRRFVTWFQSQTAKERTQRTNMDSAWRELMNDSRDRQCVKSVKLLNQWMECRTTQGLEKDAVQ